jgi:hypothetical protein
MNQNNAINKIATQVGEREIVITRVFDAPRDLVFDAWTKRSTCRSGGDLEVLRRLFRSLI